MPRVIWKGAISFGLVHVPVALMAGSGDSGIDFDWLDKRSMDPVGYRRINKRTGKEIKSADIVKGVKLDDGDYVVIGEDEIRAAYPKTTQTIAIESFVAPTQIPFTLLEKPYYLEPLAKGEKVYALLREAMRKAGVLGIARVVMHTKEHLAALVPLDAALVLVTLRWASELRPLDELKLPPAGIKAAGIADGELKMATKLIAEMTEDWNPDRYTDRFTESVMALVEQRAEAGETESVQPQEEAPAPASNVVDLTELLKRSLGGKDRGGGADDDAPAKSAAKKSAPRKRAAANGSNGRGKAAPARARKTA